MIVMVTSEDRNRIEYTILFNWVFQETFENVGGYFGLSQLGGKVKDATKHRTVHRTAPFPTNKELSSPKHQRSQICKTLVYTRHFGKTYHKIDIRWPELVSR